MFRRHRTGPDRELDVLVGAFHDRLAGTSVSVRTDPPRIDGRDLRVRLGASSIGLRDRLDRRVGAA